MSEAEYQRFKKRVWRLTGQGDATVDALFDQHDMIVDLEERLHAAEMAVLRYDEGIRCLQWLCSGEGEARMELYPAQLSELAMFGRTGREPEWIEDARREIGR